MNTPFEKRICYTLCVCEMTAVLSCVSIFYLTFAIYLPAYRQIHSGFSQETVMCTTQSNVTLENCEIIPGVPSWSSCGEWCLSKSGGSCTQIRVDVRKNGTNVRLEECETEMEDVVYCDGFDPRQPTAECITGQCAHLTGLYNCSLAPVSPGVTEAAYGARCRDLTTVLSCNLTSTDPGVQCKTKKACLHLNGLYLCRKGLCSRVRPPFKCEKKCTGIQTGGKSIIVRENDVIFTAKCKRAVDMETNDEIWPKALLGYSSLENTSDIRGSSIENTTQSQELKEPPMLVMYCTTILDRQQNMTEIRMLDCFNGTLMEPGYFGEQTDIIKLVKGHTENTRMLDPLKIIAPVETELQLVHNAPLYINYEGCVNTLILRECEKFYAQYGVDGSDLRSNARFPCFFRPNFTDETDTVDSNFVILRFDIERTTMELLLATVIPITLAVISCTMLVLCSKVVKIDDESHFFLEACNKSYHPPIPELPQKK